MIQLKRIWSLLLTGKKSTTSESDPMVAECWAIWGLALKAAPWFEDLEGADFWKPVNTVWDHFYFSLLAVRLFRKLPRLPTLLRSRCELMVFSPWLSSQTVIHVRSLILLSWQIMWKTTSPIFSCLPHSLSCCGHIFIAAQNKYQLCDWPPWHFLVQEIS